MLRSCHSPNVMPKLPQNQSPSARFLSVPELARILDLSIGRTRRLISSGAIAAINVSAKAGGRPTWRVPQESLDAFKAARLSLADNSAIASQHNQ